MLHNWDSIFDASFMANVSKNLLKQMIEKFLCGTSSATLEIA